MKTYWEVTALNLRTMSFMEEVDYVLNGEPNKSWKFETRSEAYDMSAKLKEQGIITNIANVTKIG